jgi:DNA invertase Pin-like site-specific DNA recombinase
MIYAYLRELWGKRGITDQQGAIVAFSLTSGIKIDKEVIEYSNQNKPFEEREQFQKFIHGLENGDVIIVDEIWMLSEHIDEIVKIIHCMLGRGILLYSAASRTKFTSESTIGEIFPLLNSIREEQKNKQNQIGRPKGSKSKSKFDPHISTIIENLKAGMNVSAISRGIGVSRSSLKDYIESRKIKEMIDNAWVEVIPSMHDIQSDDQILICPFEQMTLRTIEKMG